MFKKDQLVVKLEPKPKTVEERQSESNPQTDIGDVLERVVALGVVGIGVYMLGDAFRQIAIYTAMQKITPRAPRVIAEIADVQDKTS